MIQTTKVSIVMPTYNVEKYIAAAIDSIILQTYTDWELIIVDDCSTDTTISIIKNYIKKDRRITLIKRMKNSGGCRLPRFDGIMASNGEFVCPIDSDDTIEKDYLRKLIARQKETGTDIVLGRMIFCNESQIPKDVTLPIHSYDMDCILSGKEACRRTIGTWRIAMNGLFAKTDLYKEFIRKTYLSDYNGSFSDEIDHRKLLLSATSVSMTDAHYLYRQQPNSIIHTKSVRYYDTLIANERLLRLVYKTFKDDKVVLEEMNNDYIDKIYRSEQKYLMNIKRYNKEERTHITKLIKESYSLIRKKHLNFSTYKHKLLASSFCIFKVYSYIITRIIKIIYK